MTIKTRLVFLYCVMFTVFLTATIFNSFNQEKLFETTAEQIKVFSELLKKPEIGTSRSDLIVTLNDIEKKYNEGYLKRSALQIGSNILLVIFSFVGIFYLLNKHVLSKLNKIVDFEKKSINSTGVGQRLLFSGGDELSLLARLYNKALDDNDQLTMGRDAIIREERKMFLTLLNNISDNMAVFWLNGTFLGSNYEKDLEDYVVKDIKERLNELQQSSSPDLTHDVPEVGTISYHVVGPCEGVRMFIIARFNEK
jgi:hypothetical protein